ncbi:MAG: class I adenylate-forming enzyme family protein [Pseudomonadota bacterium]
MSSALDRAAVIEQLTAQGMPYELIDIEQYGRPRRAFANAPATLRELYTSTASDATFLVYEDERLTFAEALDVAARFANVLIDRFGVQPGDRVAIAARNYPEWVLTFCAATSIGAVAVAMNSLWQGEELRYGLEDSGAKVAVFDGERLARLDGHREGLDCQLVAIRSKSLVADALGWDALVTEARTTLPEVAFDPDDDAIIFYTSGSTGHPKGVVSSHRAVVSALLSWELEAQIAVALSGETPPPPPTQLATLLGVPLFHATGSHAVFLACYRAQRKMVCMYKWDVEQALALIEQERIINFVAPSAMTGDLITAAAQSTRDLSSLRVIGGGGAARAPEQVARITRAVKTALPNTGWGMTETNAIGTAIGGQDYLDHPASSGRCSAIMALRVVDAAGQVLPAGERGELQISGTAMFRGYWNRPDATAEVYRDGWLSTGDVAYIDEAGYLFIVDRLKDLVIRGGENIGCGEVEAALLEHDAVLEAAVYGVPDERLGEEVGATLYLREPVADDALRAFLKERVAVFKVPRYLLTHEGPLPRIGSGKINKRALREQAHAHWAS